VAFDETAELYALAGLTYPVTPIDEQELYSLAFVPDVDPNKDISDNQLYGLMGMGAMVYPDAVIRENDLLVLAALYPVNNEAETVTLTFDPVLYFNPTWSATESTQSINGQLIPGLSPITASLVGAFSADEGSSVHSRGDNARKRIEEEDEIILTIVAAFVQMDESWP